MSSSSGQQLSLEPIMRLGPVPPATALEQDFPVAAISRAAEAESWRKEIHRPATHTHKWWAQRLGSVFRGILTAAVTESAEDALSAYNSKTRIDDVTIFDPFSGSGTTLVEAAKLGMNVVGRDINPVATLVERQALQQWDEAVLRAAFKEVEAGCRDEIDELHRDRLGRTVLYYFWVARTICPTCQVDVDLFTDYVFARHAYPKRVPLARALCPVCSSITSYDLSLGGELQCSSCGSSSPRTGPVGGQSVTCPNGHAHRVIEALAGKRPEYRMYAKLLLDGGTKRYEPVEDFDVALYANAAERLQRKNNLVLPAGRLETGYNTAQAIRWGFREWRDFFNERQLYCLGLLGSAIRSLGCPAPEREALVALFSGTLEFNNMFCSYKGEGTGAVRHMFSHHILKPERVPLEAHPWGTPFSSGSFSTLFESRLGRAASYKASPFDIEVDVGGPRRVHGISAPLSRSIITEFRPLDATSAYISSGSSADTDLPAGSVDLIVTDPPYLDNVHYSELADFFHAWLRQLEPHGAYPLIETTRMDGEVQHTEVSGFEAAIAAVWKECARIVRPTGLLAFTFHETEFEGWAALFRSLLAAGWMTTSVVPVKAEMSVASPKSAAREPSNLDSIVVCRPGGRSPGDAQLVERAAAWLKGIREAGIRVGAADIRSVITGAFLGGVDDLTMENDASLKEATNAAVARVRNLLESEDQPTGDASKSRRDRAGTDDR